MASGEFSNPAPVTTFETLPPSYSLRSDEVVGIDAFGADRQTPAYSIADQYHTEVFAKARPTVQIKVGSEQNHDLVEINDVSESPWRDAQTGRSGNFVAVHYVKPESSDGYEVAGVHRLYPDEMLAIGREQTIGSKESAIAVSRNHASVGITIDNQLMIANNYPTYQTTLRNLNKRTSSKIPALSPETTGTTIDPGELQAAIDVRTGQTVTEVKQGPKYMAEGGVTRAEQERALPIPQRQERQQQERARYLTLGSTGTSGTTLR